MFNKNFSIKYIANFHICIKHLMNREYMLSKNNIDNSNEYNDNLQKDTLYESDVDSTESGDEMFNDFESSDTDTDDNDDNDNDKSGNKYMQSRPENTNNNNDTETENDIDEQVDDTLKDETQELMKKNFSYADQSDPNIQYKTFIKREYYYNKAKSRPDIDDTTDYSVIKDYRDNTCPKFALHEHQSLLSNLINPNTPYKGIIVFHGLGSGKCVNKNTMVYVNGSYIKIENK